jgi:hypothetical protein
MSFRYSSCFSFSSPNMRSDSTSENPMMALSEGLRLALQRLRQAILEVVSPGALALPRLADDRRLGSDLRLRGLGIPTQRPLFASQSVGRSG